MGPGGWRRELQAWGRVPSFGTHTQITILIAVGTTVSVTRVPPSSWPASAAHSPHAGAPTTQRALDRARPEPEPGGPDHHIPNLSSLPALSPPSRTTPSHALVTAGHASLLLSPGPCRQPPVLFRKPHHG